MARGLSPVVGVVCLLAVTVVLATIVGVSAPVTIASEPTVAAFETTVEPTGEVRLTHQAGDPIDPGELRLRISVDGEPLAEQPPVPFFSAPGFESGPGGVFNSATADRWDVGETASLTIADTNAPSIEAGDTVTIRLYADGDRIASLETTA
jgi:flagellin-like protein